MSPIVDCSRRFYLVLDHGRHWIDVQRFPCNCGISFDCWMHLVTLWFGGRRYSSCNLRSDMRALITDCHYCEFSWKTMPWNRMTFRNVIIIPFPPSRWHGYLNTAKKFVSGTCVYWTVRDIWALGYRSSKGDEKVFCEVLARPGQIAAFSIAQVQPRAVVDLLHARSARLHNDKVISQRKQMCTVPKRYVQILRLSSQIICFIVLFHIDSAITRPPRISSFTVPTH